MANATRIEELVAKLEEHQKAYEETRRQVEELLGRELRDSRRSLDIPPGSPIKLPATGDSGQSPAKTPEPPDSRPGSPRQSLSRPTVTAHEKYLRKTSTGLSLQTVQTSSASKATGEESDGEEDESYFAQELLEPISHEHDELREHLKTYDWDKYCIKILATIVNEPTRLRQAYLFPTTQGDSNDRSHYSHYQVFDVGKDGAPLPVDVSQIAGVTSKATALWHAIKDINQPNRERMAVGRITIAREPSPILFGALHLTMHNTFDVDELFRHLVQAEASSSHCYRAFDDDPRRQCSFVFSFEYFTIIGEECEPMRWQLADRQLKRSQHHIPITRCSSVVALALNGKPIRKIRNPARRATTAHGWAYDPWASWQVLNIQCYPDWKSSTDIHDSSKHYVNGPEAFMYTLIGEYRDAQRRFEDICKRIAKLVTPPLDFMFNPEIRDALLFEDGEFTYSRRYFWAFQTLGIMNDSIKAMVDAYEETFTEDVWLGQHRTLWPLLDENSPKNVYYERQMAKVRKLFEVEIRNLVRMIEENNRQRKMIQSLRDQLFSGTSVLESRKSVEGTLTTVQQGHNIKILTLVSMVFLPLTFVTGVFGMTNMSDVPHFWKFGVVTVTVCVPFLLLVGSLNTTSGMAFWRQRTKNFWHRIVNFSVWLIGLGKKDRNSDQPLTTDDEEEDLKYGTASGSGGDGGRRGANGARPGERRTASGEVTMRLRGFTNTAAPVEGRPSFVANAARGARLGASEEREKADQITGLSRVESPQGLSEVGRVNSRLAAMWRSEKTKGAAQRESFGVV